MLLWMCNNYLIQCVFIPKFLFQFFNRKKYNINLYINDKINEEEFLFNFPHNINNFKEINDKDFDPSCKICYLKKTTIYTCSYKEHCLCVDCFCNWYKSHEGMCILCFKEFSL